MSNVVELKVGLHCEECIKKILKTIKKFEDIESYDVDTKQNKVTVTGNVTNEQIIKALQKIGKQASNWEVEENTHLNPQNYARIARSVVQQILTETEDYDPSF